MKYFLVITICSVLICCSPRPIVLGGVIVKSDKLRKSNVSMSYLGAFDDSTIIIPIKKDSCNSYPRIITEALSVYPEIAIRAGVTGVVKIKMFVDTTGVVRKSIVVQSEGEVFNKPAIDAAMQYSFDLYEINCRQKSFTADIEFTYSLENPN